MSDFEVKRDKTKAIKGAQDTIDKYNEIVKKSGKSDAEFFEDLVNDLAIKNVVDPFNDSVSPDLRKHFESDVAKLKNATNSIISIFTSQMENITVEKNQWHDISSKQISEKQEAMDKLNTELEDLKQQFEVSKQELTELTKVNEGLTNEKEVLLKRTEDQEQLIHDRNEKVQDLQERINKLNENIVDKDEQLKSFEPMKEELAGAQQEIQSLKQENERLIQKHQEEINKQKETLVFACQKEKHELESALKEKFIEEKETLRNEVRKETEQNIREFYLAEIQRKEDDFKNQIAQLQEQIKTLSTPKRTTSRQTKTTKKEE